MATSDTTLKAGDNLPPRGKSNKTRILNALRHESVRDLLDLKEGATREEAEEAYFVAVGKLAFNADDPNSAMLIKFLGDKGWNNLKPTLDPIHFDFPVEGTPTQKAFAIVEAISNGSISPDVGQVIIGIIKDAVIIEEGTELKERIEAIEKLLESNG